MKKITTALKSRIELLSKEKRIKDIKKLKVLFPD